jgi:RecA-family ATPase
MSYDPAKATDDGDDRPRTGAEILDAFPEAKAKAEAKEAARSATIKGRIRSIRDLGEGEWWMAESIKPRRALLRYPGDDRRLMMPRGEVCSLVGSDGAGKSRILMQLCLSIATGQKFLDTYIPEEPGRVLYICGEEDEEEIMRRLFWALKDSGLRDNREIMSLVVKNFRCLSQKGRDTRLQKDDLSESDVANELHDAIRDIADDAMADGTPLALVVLDPLSWFAGNDTEKDSIAATQFVRVCQRFTEVLGQPTVLVCHHTGKAAQRESAETEDASTTDMRGSSGLSAAFRFGINIIKLKPPTGVEKWQGQTFLKFVVKKNNYGPEDHEGIRLKIVNPGVVQAMPPDEVEEFDADRRADRESVAAKRVNATKKPATSSSRYGKGNRGADARAAEVDDDC